MKVRRDRSTSFPDLIFIDECRFCRKYYRNYQGHFDKGYFGRKICSDVCNDFQKKYLQTYADNIQVKMHMIWREVYGARD